MGHYDYEIDPHSDSTHAKVVRLVGHDKRVLELGCATGYMSRVLRDQGCQVVAIELDQEAAQRAAPFCERVVVGDIEGMDLEQELGQDCFDVIVAADFLEHLKAPLTLLRRMKPFLRPSGYVVASLPNVAHGSVRLALLSGSFPYSERGLLDRTHLHFYTRQSVEKLFEDAGFAVAHLERQDLVIEASEVAFDPSHVSPDVLERLSQDPEALTYQFVLVAYPLPDTELPLIQHHIRELREARDTAQSSLQHLTAELTCAQQQISRLEAEKAATQQRSEQLTEALRQVEQHVAELSEARLALQRQNEDLAGQLKVAEQTIVATRRANEAAQEEIRGLQDARAAAERSFDELAADRQADALELKALRQTVADQTAHLDTLAEQLAVVSSRRDELRRLLLDAHDQLIQRDDGTRQVAGLQEELRALKATRVFRLMSVYWLWHARFTAIRRRWGW